MIKKIINFYHLDSLLWVACFAFLRISLLSGLELRLAYITLYPAVIFATLTGGLLSGLSATVLSSLFVIFWHQADGQHFLNDSMDWLGLSIFILNCIFISIIGWKLILAKSSRKKTESLFNNVLENAPIGMHIATLDGRIILSNRAMRELVGLDKNDFENLFISDLTHPDDRIFIHENFQRLLDGEKKVVYQNRYLHKEGSLVWAQVSLSLEKDNAGNPQYVIGQVEDISTRKQAENLLLKKENALIESQHNLQSLLNNMPAMIGYWDKNLINKLGNKNYEEWFGLSTDQLYGKHIRDVIGEKLYALNTPNLQAVLRGEPQFFERIITDVSGKDRYTQATYLPDISDGEVKGFFVLVTDVTELKTAQQRIAESEASLRAIYDNLPFLAWMKDKQGKYIKANKHWLQTVNIANVEQLSGLTDFDIWPKALAEHYRSVDEEVMQTRQQICLTENALDGGRETWTETIKSPVISDKGEVLGTTGLARDITESRSAEEKLRKYSERLRLASKAAAIGICEWDISTGLAVWDEKMYEIFGIPEGTAVDFNAWANTVFPDDLPCSTAKIRSLVEEKQEVHWEFRIRRQNDGELRYIQASAIAGLNDRGALRNIVGVNLDVTEVKLTEMSLLDKKAHLAQAQAQAHLGSWVINIINNQLSWSDENYRIFGVPLDTPLTYDHFMACVHPDDRSFVDAAWHAACQGAKYDIQHRIVVDGKVKWVRERAELEFADDGRLLSSTGTTQDITELKAIQSDLERSRQQLRQLSAKREKAREEERRRIAREVHDELGQMLTALRMDISLLRLKFLNTDQAFKQSIHQIIELVDKTIQVTRDVATSLRPAAIEMGIVPALEALRSKFFERSGIQCILNYPDDSFNMDDEYSIVVFRIVQESLTNILRYAEATKVSITLKLDADNYVIEIHDDGRGFEYDKSSKTKSFGLIGIQERALMLNGEAAILSTLGGGTLIRVTIPLKHDR